MAELEWGETSVAELTDRMADLSERLGRIDDLIDEVQVDLADGRPVEVAELLGRLEHERNG